jgi:hypothetical protein
MAVLIKTTKPVAVVVPIYNRKEFTPDEQISLRHLVHFLGQYDKYLVAPKGLDIDCPGFQVKHFDKDFFGSAMANTQMMLSATFYKEFIGYRYILLYHLDALVFSDQLMEWCETDFDYIGAPWVTCQDTPFVNNPRVGNGGFSLRRIESFLKVIHSNRYWVKPEEDWAAFCRDKPRYLQYLNLPRKFLKRLPLFNNARRELAQWHLRDDGKGNEDYFWSDEATRYYPEFKVAPFEAGLRFAFEVAPQNCFELNHRQLPFGCHAWARYDRSFWEPYLLK